MRIILSSCLLIFLFSSCFKEDERLQPYGGTITAITQPVQENTSYFDFETGQAISTVPAKSWQLGFECTAAGWRIITNSGDGWFIYNTGSPVPADGITMPKNLTGLFDLPSKLPDVTAIGNWVDVSVNPHTYTRYVYLLAQRKNDQFSNMLQVVFFDVNDTAYHFSYHDQQGITDTVSILKNDTTNYVYYNFISKEQVSLEPDKNKWDLAFSPYFDMATLFNVTIPYLVGGSYINAGHTKAVIDSVTSYENITFDRIGEYDFKPDRDIPGYGWKSVTVDVSGGNATYKVKENYSYVFYTAQKNYYKLRFLSYTHNGVSGYPQFEFERLQ
jgi:hypothetical protein